MPKKYKPAPKRRNFYFRLRTRATNKKKTATGKSSPQARYQSARSQASPKSRHTGNNASSKDKQHRYQPCSHNRFIFLTQWTNRLTDIARDYQSLLSIGNRPNVYIAAITHRLSQLMDDLKRMHYKDFSSIERNLHHIYAGLKQHQNNLYNDIIKPNGKRLWPGNRLSIFIELAQTDHFTETMTNRGARL